MCIRDRAQSEAEDAGFTVYTEDSNYDYEDNSYDDSGSDDTSTDTCLLYTSRCV